ncbi:MAG TPA: DMT family transporter [Intrasporangium sp.]|uniref:DMT family transporter n=1 Tax=Intrasporangium sp. TaxID=1925024 RepID=UPI002D7A2DF3|nr:DMT family transporter [Intrasporangium sp.]HET7397018.1 DMT family transporter [Intrasporangium sp.]
MSLPGIIALSVGSAAFFSLATALKHRSAGQVPRVHHFRARDLRDFAVETVRHPLWLLGILADVGGLALQLLALHLGGLSVVQPVLVIAVLFALVLGHRIAGTRISRRELVLGAVLVASVAGFLVVSGAVTAAAGRTNRLPAVLAAAASVVVVVGCVLAARWAMRRKLASKRAASLLGVAVGTIYAGTAALMKTCAGVFSQGPGALLGSWPLYALLASGAVGVFLAQMAFQAGPLSSSLPATATTDPIVSVALGVAVFDERLRDGALPVLLSVLCLVVMSTAVVLLTRVRVAVDSTVHPGRPA